MKTLKKSLLVLFISAFLCELMLGGTLLAAKEKSKDKNPELINGETLEINPKLSSIRWYGSGLNLEQTGSIRVKKGKVQVSKQGELLAAEIIIDMNSISNDNLSGELQAKIVEHLKSADFFEVKKFPEAYFKSSSVTKISDKKYQLNGQLGIKNAKKNTNIVGFYTTDGFNYSFKGNFIFDRTEYGIKYNSAKFFGELGDKLVADTVKLSFDIKANPS